MPIQPPPHFAEVGTESSVDRQLDYLKESWNQVLSSAHSKSLSKRDSVSPSLGTFTLIPDPISNAPVILVLWIIFNRVGRGGDPRDMCVYDPQDQLVPLSPVDGKKRCHFPSSLNKRWNPVATT